MVAGIDVDRLRNTPLFAKLPESFRDSSYVLAAFDPPNLVTAARTGTRIVVTGAPNQPGRPPDLLRHAALTPLWIVVRGDTSLPLTGNYANLNRLLRQTDYTRISAQVTDRLEYDAEGVCLTPEAAAHLEQNIRAIATLTKLPLSVRVEANTVHVTGSAPLDALNHLF